MRTKAKNFRNAPKPNFDIYVKTSFVPILKPLPHLAQFLHLSAVLFIGALKHLMVVSSMWPIGPLVELLLQLKSAKGHGKNYIKVKPHLVRHLLRNFLLYNGIIHRDYYIFGLALNIFFG